MSVLRHDPAANTKKPRAPVDSGQALVELAVSALVLLTVVFGVIDFSRAIYDLEIMTSLTAEGSNLASRGTALSSTVTALEAGSAPLNMSSSGCVIATSAYNNGTSVKVNGQASQCAIGSVSRIGTVGNAATLPAAAIPPANQTVYVTEVFYTYQPITPIGNFLKVIFPSQLYDVAYY